MRNVSIVCVFLEFSVLFNQFQDITDFLTFSINLQLKYEICRYLYPFHIFCFIQSIPKYIRFLNVLDQFIIHVRKLSNVCVDFEIFCFIQSISKHIGFLNVFDRFPTKMRNLQNNKIIMLLWTTLNAPYALSFVLWSVLWSHSRLTQCGQTDTTLLVQLTRFTEHADSFFNE